jgi:hypothetical protein
MTNYAVIETRSAFLSTDFGEELARKWFGDESVDSLPCYTRGPRKGKIKGAITWTKVLRGGWIRGGGVENRVGHISERKLHEIGSDRFGSSIGHVIRDLDREESQKQYIENTRRRIDEEIRKYDMERMIIESVILAIDMPEVIPVLQKSINERNEDILVLVGDLSK